MSYSVVGFMAKGDSAAMCCKPQMAVFRSNDQGCLALVGSLRRQMFSADVRGQ